jgi:hypothetical protein
MNGQITVYYGERIEFSLQLRTIDEFVAIRTALANFEIKIRYRQLSNAKLSDEGFRKLARAIDDGRPA